MAVRTRSTAEMEATRSFVYQGALMKRLTIISAAVVATLAAAVPAFAGIAGNPSFSHKLPVRVPANAQVVTFDDHGRTATDRKSTRLNSSHLVISYAVFCLKKKN